MLFQYFQITPCARGQRTLSKIHYGKGQKKKQQLLDERHIFLMNDRIFRKSTRKEPTITAGSVNRFGWIFRSLVYLPQTSSAISFTRRSFAHCSSSVSLLPISQEANAASKIYCQALFISYHKGVLIGLSIGNKKNGFHDDCPKQN